MRTSALLLLLAATLTLSACGSEEENGAETGAVETPADASTTGAPVPVCLPNDRDCNDHPLPEGLEPLEDPYLDGFDSDGNPVDDDVAGGAADPAAGPAEEGGDDETAAASPAFGTEEAQALVGTVEASLPDEVRIARRGDETMMLTQDHVPGRVTVELDEQDDGGFAVSTVTLETDRGTAVFPEGNGNGGFPSG